MGSVVAMVGVFGGLMALFGSVVAMFTGSVGALAGVDEAGSQTARGFGALVVSFVGIGGALTARARLRLGGAILGIAALLGLALILLFYVVGAVLMLAAAGMALRWRENDTQKAR
jgi:amino acid transporter